MSKKDEALKLALEALEEIHPGNMTPMAEGNWNKAIAAIREALADSALDRMAENARELGLDYEPAQQQEPVAWRYKPKGDGGWGWSFVELKPIDAVNYTMEPLYTSPPASKPWVGLTDEEINKTFETKVWDARRSYARAIEAKLREKNT